MENVSCLTSLLPAVPSLVVSLDSIVVLLTSETLYVILNPLYHANLDLPGVNTRMEFMPVVEIYVLVI